MSGGFATVNPDSSMQIAGMEICTIDQLDPKVHKLAYISTSYSW